ncbi:MAG TPA: HEAT repeat domain-containing protein [Anaerolineales bacterium]|nr:HEAT repeat domain-containing protein [Anaerolineales bacterium]
MSSSFEQLLDTLGQSGIELPRADLTFLSDLDAAQLERFRQVWASFPDERRRELLTELGRLAQEHIELNFDRVDRMALTDPDAGVRRQAIENLWEAEDPSLVPALTSAARGDPDAAVRAAAACTLGAFVYLGELGRLPPGLLPQIEEALLEAERDSDETVRLKALESLGYSSRTEVPRLIQAAYDTGAEKGRRAALLAMGRSADDSWSAQVLAELRSPSAALRLESVKAAGELELKDAVPDLIDLLDDAAPGIRAASIWSLGQIGGRRSAEALSRLLDAAEDEDEASLLEDALDQLAFVEGTRDFTLLDLDGEADDDYESDEADESADADDEAG